MKLELAKVRIDGGTQPRAKLDQATVDDYAEALTDGAVLPPVSVFHDGRHYWLADGFHRYFGHKKIGALKIDVEVRSGTQRDAVLFSVGANDAHGLRRTNEDKRQAVMTLLSDPEWGRWTDRQIAERCAVSHTFVASLRRPEVAERRDENRDRSAKKRLESGAGLHENTSKAVEPGSISAQETGSAVEPGSTATPLRKHDTAPGKVTFSREEKQFAALADENERLKARIAELEAALDECRENVAVMASELTAMKAATDPEHAKKFLEIQAYVNVLTSQRDDWMNQCAQARKDCKRLQAQMAKTPERAARA